MLAQDYWQLKRLAVDLVLLNGAAGADAMRCKASLASLVEHQSGAAESQTSRPRPNCFVLRGRSAIELRNGCYGRPAWCSTRRNRHPAEHSAQLQQRSATPRGGSCAEQASAATAVAADKPEFANGHGGFSNDGRSIASILDDDHSTPAPWMNVIANPAFGFLVSAEGGGNAWSLNSQQNPLTPWPNDPVSDQPAR